MVIVNSDQMSYGKKNKKRVGQRDEEVSNQVTNSTRTGQTYQIGNQMLSREDYAAAKSNLGFKSSGMNTPASQQAVTAQQALETQILANNQAAEVARQTEIQSKMPQAPVTQEQQQALEPTGLQSMTAENQIVPQEPIAEAVQTGAGALAGGLAGAGTGAAIGSVIPGVGTAIGGAIGGAIGAIGGAFTKISIDKKQDVKQAFTVFKSAKSNMEWAINEVNTGKMSPMRAREVYSQSKQDLLASERFLKSETDTELKRFLGDGSDELYRVSDYISRFPEMDAEFNNAILNPNPLKVIYSEDVLTDGS